jgi:hypothetical protein
MLLVNAIERFSWPRRDGKRIRRWCHGVFHVDVVASAEFDPTQTEVLATGRFTVR